MTGIDVISKFSNGSRRAEERVGSMVVEQGGLGVGVGFRMGGGGKCLDNVVRERGFGMEGI